MGETGERICESPSFCCFCQARQKLKHKMAQGLLSFTICFVFFFLKDALSQGFSEYCWRIIDIMHINERHSTHILSIRIHSRPMHAIRISIQYVSIQYVSIQYISLHITASAGMAMNVKDISLHICISLHISRNGNEIKYSHSHRLHNIIAHSYHCISSCRACMNMQCVAGWWLALLACALAFQ